MYLHVRHDRTEETKTLFMEENKKFHIIGTRIQSQTSHDQEIKSLFMYTVMTSIAILIMFDKSII
jgi:hypothetical protein